MVGLALEGGGAKGAYQAGAYMALKKCHIKIDAVTGTSIGALNAALIASHEENLMNDLWTDASMSELLGMDAQKLETLFKEGFSFSNIKEAFPDIYRILKNKGIDISSYRAIVRNNVDEEKLRKSNIKYGLTTFKIKEFKRMNMELTQIPKGQLHDYIVASSFLPFFRMEKLIDDHYYLDGGFYNLSPVDMLIEMGCNKIYVVNINSIGHRRKIKPNDSEIIEIKSQKDLGRAMIFTRKNIEDNMFYGYYDTLKTLNKEDGFDYYFEKKPDYYYKKLNKKIDKDFLGAVSAILNAKGEKECTIKAIEYVFKSQNKTDLKEYSVKDCIKEIKTDNSDNIIIRYVKSLNI